MQGRGSPPPWNLENCPGVRHSSPRWCAEGTRWAPGCPLSPGHDQGPVPSPAFHQGRAPRRRAVRFGLMELRAPPHASPQLWGPGPPHARLSSPSLHPAGCPLSAALTHRELFKAGLCDCLGHPRGEAHPGRSLRLVPQPAITPSRLQAAISAHIFTGPEKRDGKGWCFLNAEFYSGGDDMGRLKAQADQGLQLSGASLGRGCQRFL